MRDTVLEVGNEGLLQATGAAVLELKRARESKHVLYA